MRKSFLIFLLFLLVLPARSQSAIAGFDVAEYQDKIDKTQQALDVRFCELYAVQAPGSRTDYPEFRHALFSRIDSLQNFVASLTIVDSSQKALLLQGIDKGLWAFYDACKTNVGHCSSPAEFADAYEAAVLLYLQHASILPVIQRSSLPVATVIAAAPFFQSNKGIKESKENVATRVFSETPQNILPVLFDHPEISKFDSFVIKIAKTQADRLYDYSQATSSSFGKRVRTIDDPLVKWIVKLSDLNSGQVFYPFLDNLVAGKVSFQDLNNVVEAGDKVKYFQWLVRTAIDYREQMRKGDTLAAAAVLYQTLEQKAVNDFVFPVNNLHGFPDAVRLRPIQRLTAPELYYLLVMSENALYTSTYLKIYRRLFAVMKKPASQQLLETVQYDHYKRFIRLAANYNTLEPFLKGMNRRFSDSLLKAFVTGLEKTANLEDAVDVADSYASIRDAALRKLILTEVAKKRAEFEAKGNEKGASIYHVLQTLFRSLDVGSGINLSETFGIPSVYGLANKQLQDSTGRILIQQFFYGDEDGVSQYAKFMAAYKKAGWLIKGNKEWITVQSPKGIPVIFYVNKPLDNEAELDAKAQRNLGLFLKEQKLQPTVVIHRGHSYHVSSTIAQLASSAKLVILGSCGGYQNLSGVLNICPTAQIISTKQEGSGAVNEPLIFYIVQHLQNNKDLYWPAIWQNLQQRFRRDDRFADYLPPHKNLGALFLMAITTLEGKQQKE